MFIPKFGQNSHFNPNSTHGGSTDLGNIPKKKQFFDCFPNTVNQPGKYIGLTSQSSDPNIEFYPDHQ